MQYSTGKKIARWLYVCSSLRSTYLVWQIDPGMIPHSNFQLLLFTLLCNPFPLSVSGACDLTLVTYDKGEEILQI